MEKYRDNEKSDSYNGYGVDHSDDDSLIDIRKLWFNFLKYKYWILSSVLICMVTALVYLRYATPMYNVYSKVLIKDVENTRGGGAVAAFQVPALGLMNNSSGFDNEIEVLGTTTLNKKVVRELKLYTSYFMEGKVKDLELYKDQTPIWVDIDKTGLDSLTSSVSITLAPQENGVELEMQWCDWTLEKTLDKFPATVTTEFGVFTFVKNTAYPEEFDRKLFVFVRPLETTAQAYSASLSIEPTSKTTTIAYISRHDNIPRRSSEYLNKLIEIYNKEANIDNNLEATKTADFIEERLGLITKELNMTESEIEQYKRNTGMVDYQSDANVNIQQNIRYEQELVEVGTQISLVDALIEHVNTARNSYDVIPANVGLKDVALINMISKYNEAVMERNRLLRSSSETAPSVVSATNLANEYLMGVDASLASVKRQLQIQRGDLQGQLSKYNTKISSSPSKERALKDISRQQEVKAGLYLMLLQKREENAITLASTALKAKIIDEPLVNSRPVSPRRSVILLLAFVIGFVIPVIIIYIKNLFSFRVEDKDDIAKLTDIPILCSIPFVKALTGGNRAVVVQENRNSVMVEVYRALRSNLPFVLKPGQNVILFTSSSAGEGKTSIASNLGASIAFMGKKVLLVGLDLRKPRLASLFDISNTGKGFSNFLARDSKDFEYLDSLILNSGVSENLDILPAGAVPPNPSELLERENLSNAIDYLKHKYDYVLLDTAPVGIVSDTLSIGRVADLTIYVVRANYSLKADVDFVNTLALEHRLPNVNLIFNAYKAAPNGGYGSYSRYGSYYGRKGYGYGYGYGYSDKIKGEALDEV